MTDEKCGRVWRANRCIVCNKLKTEHNESSTSKRREDKMGTTREEKKGRTRKRSAGITSAGLMQTDPPTPSEGEGE